MHGHLKWCKSVKPNANGCLKREDETSRKKFQNTKFHIGLKLETSQHITNAFSRTVPLDVP